MISMGFKMASKFNSIRKTLKNTKFVVKKNFSVWNVNNICIQLILLALKRFNKIRHVSKNDIWKKTTRTFLMYFVKPKVSCNFKIKTKIILIVDNKHKNKIKAMVRYRIWFCLV